MLNPRMTYSKDGLALTTQFEGFQDRAYKDSVGVWTCGYGHTRAVGPSTVCTQDLAREWLLDDVQFAANAVNDYVEVTLNQHQFDALVDFVFNLGAGNFLRSSLLQLLNEGDFEATANQFERWDKAGGVVLAGLLRRRQAEKTLFKTPDTSDTPDNGEAS